MTRAELIDSLAKQFVYYSPQTVDAAVREVFEIMIETLSLGERIEIRGFGSFEVRIHEPRVAHNPKTGEQVNLNRRRVVHFKPGVELRDRVNSINNDKVEAEQFASDIIQVLALSAVPIDAQRSV